MSCRATRQPYSRNDAIRACTATLSEPTLCRNTCAALGLTVVCVSRTPVNAPIIDRVAV